MKHFFQLSISCRVAVLLALILSTASGVIAQQTISYQGFVTDAAAKPLTGSHTMTISLYDVVSGGTPLYTEIETATVNNGIFTVSIGTQNPLRPTLDFNKQYYLGVNVDGGAELAPRTALAFAPYAMKANVADTARYFSSSGIVTSVNNQSGAVTLQGGGGTTINTNGSTITISSSGSGGTGIQGIQNSSGALSVTNPNGPVATIDLANGGVTAAKLSAGAVTTNKINSGNALAGFLLMADGSSGATWSAPSNQTITLTGDVTGSGTTTIATALVDAGTPGTYTKVTTDAKGRVTSSAQLAASDIPTITENQVTNLIADLSAKAGASSIWSLIGNAGTVAGTNFIGTTDNVSLQFRANNVQSGLIETGGTSNTGIGYGVLKNNTTGSGNTSSGFNALYKNTTGKNNSAFGDSALYSNTIGKNNDASGYKALYSNTIANDNTASGIQALYSNISGSENTAVGFRALYSNTTGTNNTACGSGALYSDTTGYSNTANGTSALSLNSTGYENTAAGVGALSFNTTGNNNTAGGTRSLYSNTTGNYNTAIGANAIFLNTAGSNNTACGNSALYSGGGFGNAAYGSYALYSNNGGSHNAAIGDSALYSNTTGYSNTAGGSFALNKNTTGYLNTAIGDSALYSNTTGTLNTADGVMALHSNIDGLYNAASGGLALGSNTNGSDNTAVGYQALLANMTGNNNTALGMRADVSANNLSNVTVIGAGAVVCASNTMRFGNGNVIGWGFGVCPAAGNAIQVGTGATNGNGAKLTTGGVWTNGSSRTFKDRFHELDGVEVLTKIMDMNVLGWYYKGTNEYHIGPVAEDFYSAFHAGNQDYPVETERYISTVDPAGIALIGIKELKKENDRLKEEVISLRKEIEAIKAALKK